MSKWMQNKLDATGVVEIRVGDNGIDARHICDCALAEDAEQIAREHNANEALVAELKGLIHETIEAGWKPAPTEGQTEALALAKAKP